MFEFFEISLWASDRLAKPAFQENFGFRCHSLVFASVGLKPYPNYFQDMEVPGFGTCSIMFCILQICLLAIRINEAEAFISHTKTKISVRFALAVRISIMRSKVMPFGVTWTSIYRFAKLFASKEGWFSAPGFEQCSATCPQWSRLPTSLNLG